MNWIAGAMAICTAVSRSLMNHEQRQQVKRRTWLTMWGMVIGVAVVGVLAALLTAASQR